MVEIADDGYACDYLVTDESLPKLLTGFSLRSNQDISHSQTLYSEAVAQEKAAFLGRKNEGALRNGTAKSRRCGAFWSNAAFERGGP